MTQTWKKNQIAELPQQLIKAKDWERLERLLCDLRFIEAKCTAGMTYELVREYAAALAALPEAEEERQKESEHEKRIMKYTENLIAFSRGEIPSLKVIPSVTPWTEDEIKKDSDRIVQNPTRLDRIRAFSQFVNSESHVLAKFGHIPGFCLQQAYNSARFGTVADAAESLVSAGVDQVLLLKSRCQRPEYDPHPALLRTLAGHRGLVYSVSVTPDGRRAVSASSDRTVRVWDLESGECLQ